MWQYLHRFKREFFPSRDEFDSTHGTDTGGLMSLHRLDIQSANKCDGIRYQATDPAVFQRAMWSVPVEGYTFVDLGCGKGRVLWMAQERGYHDIIGVEFSPHLAKIARRNVRGMGIAIFTEDAAAFTFPKVPLIIFLFNPFRSGVMQKVVDRLALHPHPVFVVYVNPLQQASFRPPFERMEYVRERDGILDSDRNWAIWRKP